MTDQELQESLHDAMEAEEREIEAIRKYLETGDTSLITDSADPLTDLTPAELIAVNAIAEGRDMKTAAKAADRSEGWIHKVAKKQQFKQTNDLPELQVADAVRHFIAIHGSLTLRQIEHGIGNACHQSAPPYAAPVSPEKLAPTDRHGSEAQGYPHSSGLARSSPR